MNVLCLYMVGQIVSCLYERWLSKGGLKIGAYFSIQRSLRLMHTSFPSARFFGRAKVRPSWRNSHTKSLEGTDIQLVWSPPLQDQQQKQWLNKVKLPLLGYESLVLIKYVKSPWIRILLLLERFCMVYKYHIALHFTSCLHKGK